MGVDQILSNKCYTLLEIDAFYAFLHNCVNPSDLMRVDGQEKKVRELVEINSLVSYGRAEGLTRSLVKSI